MKTDTSLQDLHELAEQHFKTLTPDPHQKAFTIPIKVAGYADLLGIIHDLLTASMAAIEENEDLGDASVLLVNPRTNTRTLLELALQLLPHHEAEYLDRLQEVFMGVDEE